MNEWVFTINETARLLKVNERTVRRMIASGALPAVKIGGSVRIPADRLRECLGLRPTSDQHPEPVAVAGGAQR